MPNIPPFPKVRWNHAQVTFLPRGSPLPDLPVQAVLGFPFSRGRVLLANIRGRGWSVPGGHLEPGESPESALRREIYEETGALVGPLRLLGNYTILPSHGPSSLVAVYKAQVVERQTIPASSESLGAAFFTFAECAKHYYFWDVLVEAVCRYAFEDQW